MNSDFIRFLEEIGKHDTGFAGGKGANLGEIFRARLPVPPAFVVTTKAYEDEAERLTREDVDGHQRELLKDLVDVIEDARTQMDIKDSEFLHAPIWFSTFEYRGRSYTILLDAASGEVVRGDIPPPSGGFGEFLKGAGRDLLRG